MLSCSDWSALCNQELHHHNGILSQLLLKIRIHSFTIRFLVLGFGAIFVVVIMSARARFFLWSCPTNLLRAVITKRDIGGAEAAAWWNTGIARCIWRRK